MKRCMYCGHENDDASLNCSKCGNRLLDMPTESAIPLESTQEIVSPDDSGNMPVQEAGAAPVQTDGANPAADGFYQDSQVAAGTDQYEGGISDGSYPDGGFQNSGYPGDGYPGNGEDFLNNQDFYRQSGEQPVGNQQYAARPDVIGPDAFEGQAYGYPQGYSGQPEVQQQYGGQAYGYPDQVQQYGYPGQDQEAVNYARAQQSATGGTLPLMVKARKRVKSFLFFLITLLFTIKTAASIVNIVTGNTMLNFNTMQAQIQKALQSNLAIRFMNSVVDLIQEAGSLKMMAIGLGLCIPGVLICLGMWIMFFQTKRNTEEMSTSGYTLVKVIVLLQFIAICLVLAAGLILSVAFVVAAGAASSVASIVVGVVLLLILILASALTVLYYVQLLHALKVMKWNARTGADVGKMSLYVPIVTILMAILSGLSMLPMAPNDYLGLVGQGALAAWLLFAGIWALVYRGTVKRS